MTRTELDRMSQEELIDLILAQAQQFAKMAEQNAKLQAEIDAFRMKLAKSKKPPSSQPPSKDQKSEHIREAQET